MIRKNKADEKAPAKIKYHSGFVSALELLLWPYREQVMIEPEKWLSTEGIRMDVLLLKKDPAVQFDFDIGRIFKRHNILEYKRPDDKLHIDVFAKVMAYADLYKSQGIPVDAVPFNEISVTIYRHVYPRDFFRQLKSCGARVTEQYPGIYYVTDMYPFAIQILVGKQLVSREYAMFRVLTPGADDTDILTFKDIALRNKDAAYQKSVDTIFQVSIMANEDLYSRLLKENLEMCEAMRRIMKDDFIQAEADGEARGIEKGKIKGAVMVYHEELNLSPSEIIQKIITRFNLKQGEAQRFVEETLNLQKI